MVILPFVFVYQALMSMNSKLLYMFAIFYLTVILVGKTSEKKLD
jgi:hypothetical protein